MNCNMPIFKSNYGNSPKIQLETGEKETTNGCKMNKTTKMRIQF